MPLLDHFHAPLAPRRHWESFHVNWAGAIADALNERLLPEGYFAEEHAHAGARVEIDVATFADSTPAAPRNGPTATLPARVWTPPAPAIVFPAAFPDSFEVLIFEAEGGATLVAAIELVSPANKDRAAHRQAFAIKCASYLCQGISLVIVDIVTSRQANLHNDVMRLLGQAPAPAALPDEASLYAVAYRPIVRGEAQQIEAWPSVLALGQPLPTVPLALNAEVCLPVDLEETYTAACQRRRLA
ncbi:MAG TPA: DUF4058 family protein [Gemmataceae bacterium]|nr:DUF4058 family protein [Gemmataceae bacterium]